MWQNIIAMVYDFDGTLTPKTMQDYTVLPKIQIRGKKFWEEVENEKNKTKGDQILTYMRLMLRRAKEKNFPITRETLQKLAERIEYYPGVETFFDRIKKYVKKKSKNKVQLKHYIISAGLKEIIEGAKIADKFENIFACEYYYDEYKAARFPKVAVNYTLKTQFLFRINKGKEDLNQDINQHMPPSERPIPFSNIIYIGDGLTDVPCMTLTKKEGGCSIAVYKPRSSKEKESCLDLFRNNRINFMTNADFRGGKELDKIVKQVLNLMIERIYYTSLAFKQKDKYL